MNPEVRCCLDLLEFFMGLCYYLPLALIPLQKLAYGAEVALQCVALTSFLADSLIDQAEIDVSKVEP